MATWKLSSGGPFSLVKIRRHQSKIVADRNKEMRHEQANVNPIQDICDNIEREILTSWI